MQVEVISLCIITGFSSQHIQRPPHRISSVMNETAPQLTTTMTRGIINQSSQLRHGVTSDVH